MTIPIEFTSDYLEAHSAPQDQLYRDFLRCGEPWQSMFSNNPWMIPPDPREPLPAADGQYWDTTVARKHYYWKDVDLPAPTYAIDQLRKDLREWGYCLIKDAMSPDQCERFRSRLMEQAEGERLAGIAQPTPSGQYVNTLINKGKIFAACIEQNPEAVQGGPVIEQLLDETLGKGWICHSFLANGADPGGYPQGLHIDQGPLLPWVTEQAPALVNSMYIPEAVDESNGGTLIIPGSHHALIEAGSGGAIGELPPPVNLEAPAGTVMVFDGRVLHGTGINHSDKQRFVATMSNVKSWMRTQENWVLSVAPDVLEAASDKLLHRLGLQALTYGATVEGFGLGASGRIGDPWGAIRQFRTAYDNGMYRRVRELSADSPSSDLTQEYTVHQASLRARERAPRR
jgi:ectoine hydroxylase-related dioxygenase (phytanoyl-CoA dioxygenase family)